MNKRQFLAGAAGSMLSATALKAHAAVGESSLSPLAGAAMPVVLTVSGAIHRTNRGPIEAARDQMMYKQGVKFAGAFEFDFATLAALPKVTIKPTLEYDNQPHALSGPLVTDVLADVGATLGDTSKILFRAVDGYNVMPDLAMIQAYRFILATHLDGAPISIGGLGPLWAVYDADAFPDMAAKPLKERFPLCPWGVYQIEVVNV